MKKRYKIYSLVALLFLSGVQKVGAQAVASKLITTAAPSLRITPDARAGGMGETGIATPADAASMYWNLSKLPFAGPRSAVGVYYTPWLRDVTQGMYLLDLSGYHRTDSLQAIAGSVRYFNLGDFALQDKNGNLLQTARPYELSVDVGYARKLSDRFSLGLAFRYINSTLTNGSVDGTVYKAGEAFAADLSMYYNGVSKDGNGFSAGLALSNLGSRISYTNNATAKDYLPANLGIGGAYTTVVNEDHTIVLAADINKLLVPAIPGDSAGLARYYSESLTDSWTKSFEHISCQYSAGVEYSYRGLFSARAGYYSSGKEMGDRKGFTAGLGLRYAVWGIDLSYQVPSGSGAGRNPLSNTLRFGVQFHL